MSFIQNITENYSSFRIAIYNEEEILYNSKLIDVQREVRINYEKENIFSYYQKIASDFVSNVAYRCLALDMAINQSSSLVLVDPADSIDLFLNKNFNISFSEAKSLSKDQKKYLLVENIERSAWQLKEEGFFIEQIRDSINVRTIFQYLAKKFA